MRFTYGQGQKERSRLGPQIKALMMHY